MTPRALARPVAALLPPEGGVVAVAGADEAEWRAALGTCGWSAAGDGVVPAAVVSFLGAAGDAAARRALLAAVRARLVPAGRLVVVDHNRPRRPLARLGAAAGLWRRGLRASRARYPAAREVAASGFVVERLRLAARERVQLVLARPRPEPGVRTT